ncbi:MAG TPA: NAD(P)-binding domain-containing protein [Gaiellaceae bacterium]|nr:NAD(P)-binding domain-containing protein [Gaiellaceae bacterium]
MQQAEHVETVIVGGGQAGLAVGYFLQKKRRRFTILEANQSVGDSWRMRWPSLRLYTPARMDGLPGLEFPAPKNSFPTAAEMADYLQAYAERHELDVRTGVAVDGLERNGDSYLVNAGGRRFHADNVVVATGVIQHERPVVPDFAAEIDPAITQLHSADYRGPEQLSDGPVLVVGASHSGGDIAYEVALAGHPTILSGRDTGQVPFDIEGLTARLLFPLLRFLATRVLTVSTPLGRKMRPELRSHGAPLLRVRRADLAGVGVERVLERTTAVVDGRPALADGRVLDVANVIWCTGFRNEWSWIRAPLPVGEDGFPEQSRGVVSSLPGLYFVGMLFLDSFASMLVLGAGRDGKRVAEHIERRMSRPRDEAAVEPETVHAA